MESLPSQNAISRILTVKETVIPLLCCIPRVSLPLPYMPFQPGSSSPRQLIYDVSTGESFNAFSIAVYNSHSVPSFDRSSKNGPYNRGGRDFFSQAFISQYSTKINNLVFGTGIPSEFGGTYGPMGFGNRYSSETTAWDQKGNSGGIYTWNSDHNGGNPIGTNPTFPTPLLTVDTQGLFMPGVLGFGDRIGSAFYPHDASTPLPFLRIGHQISTGRFAMEQTQSFGNQFNFLYSHDGGLNWNVAFTVDADAGFSSPPAHWHRHRWPSTISCFPTTPLLDGSAIPQQRLRVI